MNFATDYIAVFIVSFFSLLLELCLTRILNFKTWNHVVYVVIPFAILGYGIGANLYILWQRKIEKYPKTFVLAACLIIISILAPLMALAIIKFPISTEHVLKVLSSARSVLMLLAAYTVFIIPFVWIGFLIVYLFAKNRGDVARLYFFDLLGAGSGAAAFFYLLKWLPIFKVILFCSCFCLALSFWLLFEKQRKKIPWIVAVLAFLLSFLSEPQHYAIEEHKADHSLLGGHELVYSKWQPMGRTDLYSLSRDNQLKCYFASLGAYGINISPPPEYHYFLNDLVSGTPVFKLSPEEFAENGLRVQPFLLGLEAPYVLLRSPRVLVIGAGGGRDIFLAKTHGAKEIVGAEINPVIMQAMSPGGIMHEYSGKIYSADGVNVQNVDGRSLVKQQKPNSKDLIVLNGVDTFTGLSYGAYAYAESYLYTKNAMDDYLRILDRDGIINFNRWLLAVPRESLRLFAIALDSIKDLGSDRPWEHVVIGLYDFWAVFLVKKTPFTASQEAILMKYFKLAGLRPIFFPRIDVRPKNLSYHPSMVFHEYIARYKAGQAKEFEREYAYDVSVITDDKPFFYKFYKLSAFHPQDATSYGYTGSIIFLTQFLVFFQALFFISIFIFLPLFLYRFFDVQNIPRRAIGPFILFFSCLGAGFMFIEMPLMQRFVLFLGSPIHSLGVVLAVLLISAGGGSLCVDFLGRKIGGSAKLLCLATIFLSLYLFTLCALGTKIYDHFMNFPLLVRVFLVGAMISPLGFALGVFFPSGLRLIQRRYAGAIGWAWGINCGFSVLGSILAVILAQFLGFNFVLILGIAIYIVAFMCYFMLERGLS